MDSAGHAHAGKTGQRRGHRVEIAQVGRHRIGLGAEVVGRRRGDGAHDDVDLLEGRVELLRDQAAHLLRLDVVGVVVAVREHVGADQDAALGFGAEALALLGHVLNVGVVLGAVAVANAVKARQVRARLGAGNDVVDRHAEPRIGKLDVDDLGALAAVFLDHLLDGGGHFGIKLARKPRARHAHAQPLDALVEIAREVFRGKVFARRIPGLEAHHVAQHPGDVFGRVGHQTGGIKRACKGDHAQTARTTVGGLEAGDAGKGCGLANRAARIGCGDDRGKTRGHARSRAAGAAARNRLRIPGVVDLAVG